MCVSVNPRAQGLFWCQQHACPVISVGSGRATLQPIGEKGPVMASCGSVPPSSEISSVFRGSLWTSPSDTSASVLKISSASTRWTSNASTGWKLESGTECCSYPKSFAFRGIVYAVWWVTLPFLEWFEFVAVMVVFHGNCCCHTSGIWWNGSQIPGVCTALALLIPSSCQGCGETLGGGRGGSGVVTRFDLQWLSSWGYHQGSSKS